MTRWRDGPVAGPAVDGPSAGLRPAVLVFPSRPEASSADGPGSDRGFRRFAGGQSSWGAAMRPRAPALAAPTIVA